jgi:hypothetical protein
MCLVDNHVYYSRSGMSVSFDKLAGTADVGELVHIVNDLGGAPEVFVVECRFSAADIAALAKIRNMRMLYIKASTISADGIAALRTAGSLRMLDIGRCGVKDDIVDALAGLQQLQDVKLHEDGVSDAAISRLKRGRPGLAVELHRAPRQD